MHIICARPQMPFLTCKLKNFLFCALTVYVGSSLFLGSKWPFCSSNPFHDLISDDNFLSNNEFGILRFFILIFSLRFITKA